MLCVVAAILRTLPVCSSFMIYEYPVRTRLVYFYILAWRSLSSQRSNFNRDFLLRDVTAYRKEIVELSISRSAPVLGFVPFYNRKLASVGACGEKTRWNTSITPAKDIHSQKFLLLDDKIYSNSWHIGVWFTTFSWASTSSVSSS